jgi:hypothetical protein
VAGDSLQDASLNGRDFTQLIALQPGFGGYSAGGSGSINGTRANQVNWQIDGVDNNDLWHNLPAVNQSGVSSIAGTVLPIDAIDEFSVQTQSSPEAGRNPGGVVNLAIEWRQITDFGERATFIARRVSWSSDGRYILAAVAEGDSDIVLLEGLTNAGRE